VSHKQCCQHQTACRPVSASAGSTHCVYSAAQLFICHLHAVVNTSTYRQALHAGHELWVNAQLLWRYRDRGRSQKVTFGFKA
jgi:hypothetical protein